MQVKYIDIKNSQGPLNKLSKVKLPTKVAYRISRLISKVTSIVKQYERDRYELVKKLGSLTDKEKNSWDVKKENLATYFEEVSKNEEKEMEIDFEPIELGLITTTEGIEPELLPDWVFKE